MQSNGPPKPDRILIECRPSLAKDQATQVTRLEMRRLEMRRLEMERLEMRRLGRIGSEETTVVDRSGPLRDKARLTGKRKELTGILRRW